MFATSMMPAIDPNASQRMEGDDQVETGAMQIGAKCVLPTE